MFCSPCRIIDLVRYRGQVCWKVFNLLNCHIIRLIRKWFNEFLVPTTTVDGSGHIKIRDWLRNLKGNQLDSGIILISISNNMMAIVTHRHGISTFFTNQFANLDEFIDNVPLRRRFVP